MYYQENWSGRFRSPFVSALKANAWKLNQILCFAIWEHSLTVYYQIVIP